MDKVWEIMHGERNIATLGSTGLAEIIDEAFMPFDLWLEEGDDIDTRVGNIGNFNYWCATRVLTLDRQYAKEILASIGAMQGKTDRERAQVALSYHCLSLTDIFWVKEKGENISFAEINLYENHLSNALVDLSLRGRAMTVENAHLIADNASTSGVFPKAWLRKDDGFYLLKDGNEENVINELLASRIALCFDCKQVRYEEDYYDGALVSSCRMITDPEHSIVTREAFEIYAVNHDLDPISEILRIDAHGYYMMNIIDYIVGNTDRHWGNWGFFMDNKTGELLRLHDLMDFNQSFKAYDDIEGALCQTTLPRHISQRQAAVEAVNEIGINLIREIDYRWFGERQELANMCKRRMEVLTIQRKMLFGAEDEED